MTELDRKKVISALRLGHHKMSGKEHSEREFSNVEEAIKIIEREEIIITIREQEKNNKFFCQQRADRRSVFNCTNQCNKCADVRKRAKI